MPSRLVDGKALPPSKLAPFLLLGLFAILTVAIGGVTWRLARVFATGLPAERAVEIGVLVQSPRGPGTTAVFSLVSFTSAPLGDLRDGS